jgi:hypothetical protein
LSPLNLSFSLSFSRSLLPCLLPSVPSLASVAEVPVIFVGSFIRRRPR